MNTKKTLRQIKIVNNDSPKKKAKTEKKEMSIPISIITEIQKEIEKRSQDFPKQVEITSLEAKKISLQLEEKKVKSQISENFKNLYEHDADQMEIIQHSLTAKSKLDENAEAIKEAESMLEKLDQEKKEWKEEVVENFVENLKIELNK